MANPEIKVDVRLDDLEFNRKIAGVQSSLQKAGKEFKSLGREISEVSRTLIFFGGAVTGSIGVAFTKAAKDIPQVGEKLKEVSNAFQSLADNVAIAAAPSLESFTRLMNGVANAVSKFVLEHQDMINQFIKYSAIAVAIGTVGVALGTLFKTMQAIIKLGIAFAGVFTLANLQFLLVTAAVLGLVVALAFLSDKMFGTHWVDDFTSKIAGLKSTISKFVGDFEEGSKKGVQKATRYFDQFTEGVKSNFESLATSMRTLGAGIGAAMETGLSTAIFDVFKGKISDLKSVLISFSDDVLKAFSKMLANKALAALFGDKEGGKGLFSGIGAMLGLGGNGPSKVAAENTRLVQDNSRQFKDLTQNMKLFGRVKDQVIDKFREFLKLGKPGGSGGFAAGGVSGGVADLVSGGGLKGMADSITNAIDPLTTFNGLLGATTGFTQMIGEGFTSISKNIVNMGKTYTITQGVMVTASAVASALTVGIVALASSAIAALWAPAAVLASIATLGGAAAIGVSAVTAAVGSAPGIAASGSAGGGFGGGSGPSLEFANIPKMAEGGIVDRPTVALIGEAGPEAVVPLGKGKGMGSTIVDIHIDTAVLDNPSNMRQFVGMLKEELAR